MGGGMLLVEHRKRHGGIEERAQVGVGVGGKRGGHLMRGARRTERAALARTERQRAFRRHRRAVPGADLERGGKSEHGDEGPEQAAAQSLDVGTGDELEGIERLPQLLEAFRMGIGGREAEHNFGKRGGGGVAIEILGQSGAEPRQLERGQYMQLAVFFDEQISLALAQSLQRGTEAALGTERTLGDGALDAQIARGEADDFRGFAIAERGEDDRGRANERHAESYGVRYRVRYRVLGDFRDHRRDRALAEGEGLELDELRVEDVGLSGVADGTGARLDGVDSALAIDRDG